MEERKGIGCRRAVVELHVHTRTLTNLCLFPVCLSSGGPTSVGGAVVEMTVVIGTDSRPSSKRKGDLSAPEGQKAVIRSKHRR